MKGVQKVVGIVTLAASTSGCGVPFPMLGDLKFPPSEAELLKQRKEAAALRQPELTKDAQAGSLEAAVSLAWGYGDHEPLRRMGEAGNSAAALELARLTGDYALVARLARQGRDVPLAGEFADETGDLSILRDLSESGNASAAYELAMRTWDPSHLQHLAAAENGEAKDLLARFETEIRGKTLDGASEAQLRSLTDTGSPEVIFELAQRLEGLNPEKLVLLCRAVSEGYAKAIATISVYYRYGYASLSQDDVNAFVWMRIAEDKGFVSDTHGAFVHEERGTQHWQGYPSSSDLAHSLSETQRADAQAKLGDWTPASCPRPPTS